MSSEEAREYRRRIRAVLNREWDPICVAHLVDDEHDGYVGTIAAMIREGRSDQELGAYLEWAQTDRMSLRPPDGEKLKSIVAAIRALGAPPSL